MAVLIFLNLRIFFLVEYLKLAIYYESLDEVTSCPNPFALTCMTSQISKVVVFYQK